MFLQETLRPGNRVDLAGILPGGLLRCLSLATNDALRQEVARLIKLGVQQRAIAKRLKVSETWLSRWVNEKRESAIDTDAMDRLTAYLAEFAALGARYAVAHQERPTGSAKTVAKKG